MRCSILMNRETMRIESQKTQFDEKHSLSEWRDKGDRLGTVCSNVPPRPSPAVKTTVSSYWGPETIAKSSARSLPQRFTRQQKPLGEWGKPPTALLTTFSDISLSYSQETEGEERKSLKQSIESEIYPSYNAKTWVPGLKSQARNMLSNKWIFHKKDALQQMAVHT